MRGNTCRVATQLLRDVRTPRTARGDYVSDTISWRAGPLQHSRSATCDRGFVAPSTYCAGLGVAPHAVLSKDRVAEWYGDLPYHHDSRLL